MAVNGKDRKVLRDLAKRVAEAASLPVMEERKRLWKGHNALRRVRPMILVFPEGSWRELLPETALVCEGKEAREIERSLRMRIYTHDHFHDDSVIEKTWVVGKAVSHSRWGLEAKQIPSPAATGAWAFDPVIHGPKDLKKLRLPVVTHDEAATKRNFDDVRALFGDILEVKLKGVCRIHICLMEIYTKLRGLCETMLDMYENPAMLHDAMAFFAEWYRDLIRQYQEMNLFDLNNDGTYHASGGNGYTDEIPKPGYDPKRITPADMWASAQEQELAQVSPEMHCEFTMKYETPLLAMFALNGYGCCEDLTRKLDYVCALPNMRRISIAPSADVDKCAEKLGGRFIFSWKPQPSHLVGEFDERKVRDYIKHTLDVTKGCVVEMILKDTHTCENRPERFDRWTQIARELVEERS